MGFETITGPGFAPVQTIVLVVCLSVLMVFLAVGLGAVVHLKVWARLICEHLGEVVALFWHEYSHSSSLCSTVLSQGSCIRHSC